MSPAFTALIDVLFAGTMARMNVLFDGDPNLNVLGPEGREQFDTVILGRVPTSTWRRFAPAVHPAPQHRGRLNRGRVHVVQGCGTVHQTQVLADPDRPRSPQAGHRRLLTWVLTTLPWAQGLPPLVRGRRRAAQH